MDASDAQENKDALKTMVRNQFLNEDKSNTLEYREFMAMLRANQSFNKTKFNAVIDRMLAVHTYLMIFIYSVEGE